MPRRSKRGSPKPHSPRGPSDLEVAEMRLRGKPPRDDQPAHPSPGDLESGIIKNWELPSSSINICVPPELWPYSEPEPKKWHTDIINLLHEASLIDLEKDGKIDCSNIEHFQSCMSHEIHLRQLRNRSTSGKKSWMTTTDLKRVIKHLRFVAENEEDAESKKLAEKKIEDKEKPTVRRGRSKASNATVASTKPIEPDGTVAHRQQKTEPAPRGRERPKRTRLNTQEDFKPGIKHAATKLPIRSARQLRSVKSPKTKPSAPPPATPANPLEPEDSNEGEEDQENEPPEPVSGRHIYGDFIKPTTIDFIAGTDSEAPAQARTRQTRKRGRADNEKPPAEEQIDSDPRDIDATGFLSELDPKEARRRRKPRLSRLQDDVVLEPAWSQDVLEPPETPLLTPAADGSISGTPRTGLGAVQSSPAAPPVSTFNDPDAGIALLFEMLPEIPAHATADEREMLQEKVALLRRDIVAFSDAILEINGKVGGQ